MFLEIMFWSLFILISANYVLYPLLVTLLSFLFAKDQKRGRNQLDVTLIIAAYNEENVIETKLKNALATFYPKERLQIIVAADGSNDKTVEITETFASQGVVCLHSWERKGKTDALNRAILAAKGDIVVFSDANSMYEPEAIGLLVENFCDERVGGVCGRKTILKEGERQAALGDGMFWTIEAFIKTRESMIGSITTGDGEIFAVRKSLLSELDETIINDDCAITFNIIKEGYRVIYDPRAISLERASLTINDDFNVKARMVCGGYQIITKYFSFLANPTSLFAWQFFFHKVLRYVMPVLLIALFLLSMVLKSGFYLFFFGLQGAFYLLALLGWLIEKKGMHSGFFYFPYYYCAVNLAALKGLVYWMQNRKVVGVWQRAVR